jgi:hypothetical protein
VKSSARSMAVIKLPSDILDRILALQVTVAWAGETERLGWWHTDLIDQGGGGYFLAELLPKTYQWAGVEAVRQCAILADRQKRLAIAQPDSIRTLFFWGFAVDEQLADRLKEHKQEKKSPEEEKKSLEEVLRLEIRLDAPFSSKAFEDAVCLSSQEVSFTVTPSGRQINNPMPDGFDLCAQKLAAALLPLTNDYPMPFYRL